MAKIVPLPRTPPCAAVIWPSSISAAVYLLKLTKVLRSEARFSSCQACQAPIPAASWQSAPSSAATGNGRLKAARHRRGPSAMKTAVEIIIILMTRA